VRFIKKAKVIELSKLGQSLIMSREFSKHGIPHRLISVQGGEHGLGGGKPEDIRAAHAAVLPFIKKHMK